MPKVSSETLAEIKEAYSRYQLECVRSPLQSGAVDTYTQYVDMFIRWLEGRFEPGGTLKS